jgi:murein DD-endopeptidase MepM/ murein hydrolase activator NlpD
MIFQKPRKLPHGKELIRTKKFTFIYLGSGNFHYSYIGDKGLIYGDIDLNKTYFKIIPLITIASLITIYFILGTNPTPAISEKQDILFSNDISSLTDEEVQDKLAKNANDEYLKQTEEQKLAIINSKEKTKKPKNITYRVKDIDTLDSIAETFHASKEEILEASNLKSADELKEGILISIPKKRGLYYKFKQGDTLAKVATLYKVPIDDVLEENHLEEGDIFSPGQRIFLPGAVIPDPVPTWYSPVLSAIITSGFGWRSFPRYQFHDALDLKANYEPVRAARSGRVIYSGWMGGYGNVVILEHAGDYKTLYAHNSKLYVFEGDYVIGGKIISRSGCTGYCFGAHLHFEIIKSGKSINPTTIIKGFKY